VSFTTRTFKGHGVRVAAEERAGSGASPFWVAEGGSASGRGEAVANFRVFDPEIQVNRWKQAHLQIHANFAAESFVGRGLIRGRAAKHSVF